MLCPKIGGLRMATLRQAGVKVQHYLHLRNLTCSERTAPGQCPSPGHGNGGDCCRVYVYSTTTSTSFGPVLAHFSDSISPRTHRALSSIAIWCP